MVRSKYGYPAKQGLYSPEFEREACGVGFVAKINGEKSHQVLSEALTVLERMKHRGACGFEENCGDGAGVMTGIPHAFYQRVIQEKKLGFKLPSPGDYATGIFFIDTDLNKAKVCEDMFSKLAQECNIKVVGWRDVPYDNSMIGKTAVDSQPLIRQVFVTSALDQETFKKQVYLLRKMATNIIGTKNRRFYICSLSCDTIVYKGMLKPVQLQDFFPDLQSEDYWTHFALVHGRFSTNTFPSWERAHPNRYLAHNGEINTIRGNINNMNTREGTMFSKYYGSDTQKLFPVIEADLSDSGTVDNVLELLVMAGGRTLPEVTSYIHWPRPHVYVVDSGLAHLPLSDRRFSPSFRSERNDDRNCVCCSQDNLPHVSGDNGVEIFKNARFSFTCGRMKTEVFEYDDVMHHRLLELRMLFEESYSHWIKSAKA